MITLNILHSSLLPWVALVASTQPATTHEAAVATPAPLIDSEVQAEDSSLRSLKLYPVTEAVALATVQIDDYDEPTTGSSQASDGGVVGAGKKVGSGILQTGKNIVSLPGKAFRAGSDELPNLVEGTSELGVSGNVQFAGDTAYNVDLSYGYFFKDNWELGFTANAFGVDDFNIGAGLFTEYNFDLDSKWVPYVGGAIKWAKISNNSSNTSSAAYGGEIGVKYFLREHAALFAGFNFDWSPNDIFGIGDNIKDSTSNINIGMRFYL